MSVRSLAAGALVFLAGCNTITTTAPVVTLSLGSGNNQVGTAGAALTLPLTVLVLTDEGAPVSGTTVTWTVLTGGGSVQPATSVSTSAGYATTVFTLGAATGPQTVQASAAGITETVTFTASTTITNTTVPQLVATVPMPSGSTFHHDTFVRDGLAFVCAWSKGVLIYDVGNGRSGGSPSNPVFISQIITADHGVPGGVDAHNAWWFHNPVTGQKKYLFVGQEGLSGALGSSSSGDIHIVDVSDLAAPIEVGFIHVAGAGAHNFWMDESKQILYAAYYNGGVLKIDVSGTLSGDMSSRILVQAKPGGAGNTYVWGVMLFNGTLYATDMLSGFWALDPTTLATKGGGNNVPERYGSDQWVYGSFAYSGSWSTRAGVRGNAIKIWALGANGVPTIADSIIILNVTTISDVAVTPDGKMLIATTEGGAGNGLYVFDRAANPQHPVLKATVLVSQGLHTGEIAVINGRTYVFTARDPSGPAMLIYDITGVVP